MTYVFCDRPSHSARDLARAIGGTRARNSARIPPGPTVINWGSHTNLSHLTNPIINHPDLIRIPSNKLGFFELIRDQPYCPYFTTDKNLATLSMKEFGHALVSRHLLRGSGGAGISISVDPNEVEDAPLYVRYIKKSEEFRVHVFFGEVIDVQRKARRHAHPNPNWQVRNWENGFIYAREGVDNHPFLPHVTEAALAAAFRTKLDFGAFDVITTRDGKPYVLEVNTAPGLTGTTLDKYKEAFRG